MTSSFESQPFNKQCSGVETYFGSGFSWDECESKCNEFAAKNGPGCCEGRADSWGKCAFFIGGSEIDGFADSKSVQCSGKKHLRFARYSVLTL